MKAWERDIDPASKTEEIFFENGGTLPAPFNVDSKDITEVKEIGKGNCTVHEAEWGGRKVAVKKFVADTTFSNISSTSKEVNRMLGLRHPNVLELLGFYLTTQEARVLDCTMIMELMDFDLEKYIREKGPLSDDQVVYIIAEVARGMNHIHKRDCFHRDLKPENVLLRESIVTGFHVDVKIADFGSSELRGVGDINRTAGTTGYKAPEQFDSASEVLLDEAHVFGFRADVFGFGALCFKILTGKKPYESGRNVRETIKQLDRAAISQRNLPEDVVEMIWKCLDVNPESRPNFDEISSILDGALSAIVEKMPRPLPQSTSASLHSMESMLKGVQVDDHFESIFHKLGLSKKHAIHFIPFDELFVGQLIGNGVNSSIYKVEWKGIPYALKVLKRSLSEVKDYHYMGENYFQTFPKLVHKNIVTFMGYSISHDESICILMEMLERDLDHVFIDVYRLGGRTSRLDIRKRWMIVREIAEGMKYLHDHDVVHGDLRPGNVVVSALETDDMVVKLIDFAENPESCPTRYYAPEGLRKRILGSNEVVDFKKSDVYSFGILCNEILAGVQTFRDMHPREFRQAILQGKRPQIPIGTSPEMERLIQSCWSGDPEERPDFTKFCERLSRTVYDQSSQGQNNPKRFAINCCLL